MSQVACDRQLHADPEDYAKLLLAVVTNEMLNGEVMRLDGAIQPATK